MQENNSSWLLEKNLRLQGLVADLLFKNETLRQQLDLLRGAVAEPSLQLKCLERARRAVSGLPSD